jgi:hypothetical protein
MLGGYYTDNAKRIEMHESYAPQIRQFEAAPRRAAMAGKACSRRHKRARESRGLVGRHALTSISAATPVRVDL